MGEERIRCIWFGSAARAVRVASVFDSVSISVLQGEEPDLVRQIILLSTFSTR